MDRQLLTIDQAAEYLATSSRHVRRLLAERRLARVKIGGKVRLAVEDLDSYISAHRIDAAPDIPPALAALQGPRRAS